MLIQESAEERKTDEKSSEEPVAEASVVAAKFFDEPAVEKIVPISDKSKLIPLAVSEVEFPKLVSEAEVQVDVPSNEDLSLSNVDELLRSLTEAIQDQIIQEEKAH